MFVDHEIMSVYILKLILKKYNLYDDFKKYGLGEKVYLRILRSFLGDSSDLRDYHGRQAKRPRRLEMGWSSRTRVPSSDRCQLQVGIVCRGSPQKWRRCGSLRLHDSRLHERTISTKIERSLD